MAILCCSSCQFLKELPDKYINRSTRCPQCNTRSKIWDTKTLIGIVLNKYKIAYKEKNNFEKQFQQLTDKHKNLQKKITISKSNPIRRPLIFQVILMK